MTAVSHVVFFAPPARLRRTPLASISFSIARPLPHVGDFAARLRTTVIEVLLSAWPLTALGFSLLVVAGFLGILH